MASNDRPQRHRLALRRDEPLGRRRPAIPPGQLLDAELDLACGKDPGSRLEVNFVPDERERAVYDVVTEMLDEQQLRVLDCLTLSVLELLGDWARAPAHDSTRVL